MGLEVAGSCGGRGRSVWFLVAPRWVGLVGCLGPPCGSLPLSCATGEPRLPVPGLHLPPAQPQDAAALPAGKLAPARGPPRAALLQLLRAPALCCLLPLPPPEQKWGGHPLSCRPPSSAATHSCPGCPLLLLLQAACSRHGGLGTAGLAHRPVWPPEDPQQDPGRPAPLHPRRLPGPAGSGTPPRTPSLHGAFGAPLCAQRCLGILPSVSLILLCSPWTLLSTASCLP